MYYILPYYFIFFLIIKDEEGELNENGIKINKTIKTSAFKHFLKRLLVLGIYISYLLLSNHFITLFKREEDTWFMLFYVNPVDIMEYLGVMGMLLSGILAGSGSVYCILNFLVYSVLGIDGIIAYYNI